MLEHEARELLSYLNIITDFGDELQLEDSGGGCWSVVRKSGAGTMSYVAEPDGVFMAFYQLYDWEDGNEPSWTSLAESEEEVE